MDSSTGSQSHQGRQGATQQRWRNRRVSDTSLDEKRATKSEVDDANDAESWHNRRSEKSSLGDIPLTTSDTDASAATKICNALALKPTATSISVSGDAAYRYWPLPACVANATTTKEFYLYNSLITDFRSLPPNVTLLTCSNCSYAPVLSSTAVDGFDENGNIDWNEVWSILPSLTVFSITNSLDVRGSLPGSLPLGLTEFTLRSNAGITGTISAALFSAYTPLSGAYSPAISVTFSGCPLTGSIPPNLLQPLNNMQLQRFMLDLRATGLSGSFPSNLFGSLSSTTSFMYFYTYFGDNPLLVGSLSTFSLPKFRSTAALVFDISNTSMQGTIPSTLLSGLTDMRSINFRVSNTQISGSIPPLLFNNTWSAGLSTAINFVLDLSNNDLTGTIPANVFTSSMARNTSFGEISILLGGNKLDGSIPPSLLYIPADGNVEKKSVWNEKRSDQLLQREASASASLTSTLAASLIKPTISLKLTVNLSWNLLEGTIPGNLLDNVLGAPSTNALALSIYLQNNRFAGIIPEAFVAAIPQNLNYRFVLNVSNNEISGLPPATCWSSMPMSYYFSNNFLEGLINPAWKDCPFTVLDVSRNNKLSGTLHPQFFNSSLLSLVASRTNLTGGVPVFVASKVTKIDLSDTDIDFCGTPWDASRWTAGKADTCLLYDTSACTCPTSYTRCSTSCNPVSPTPIAPCANAPKLGPEFICVNGVWVAPSTNVTVLILPSTSGTVIVNGNVSSSSIVFNSLGSTLIIGGCPDNLTSVEIELTPVEVEKLGGSKTFQNLITFSNSSCSIDLNDVALSTKVNGGCKTVKADKLVSDDGKTLGAYFVLDSSRCNTWWIILVSVIAGVIVLGLVAVVIVGIILKNRKAKKQFARLDQPSTTTSITG